MIYHKHLLVNAKVNNAVKSEAQGIEFLRNLVERIDMKIIQGPFASYVNKEGNRGLTGIVMIETSHIAFHVWDEVRPGMVQFDLYTCGELDLDKVISIFKEMFEVHSLDYVLFDRENGFVVEQSGREADGVVNNKYPQGKNVGTLDPDLGNFFGSKGSAEYPEPWNRHTPKGATIYKEPNQ